MAKLGMYPNPNRNCPKVAIRTLKLSMGMFWTVHALVLGFTDMQTAGITIP
jgi:hypothetical protein